MNKTINELTALTDAVSSDELIIYDVSTGESKKITKQNILKELQTEVNGNTSGVTALSAIDTCNIPRKIPKDISSYITDNTLWDRIAGTNGYEAFADLHVGDYIHMSRAITASGSSETGSEYVTIAGCNTLWGDGDQGNGVNYNHLVMIAGQGFGGTQHFGKARMNSTATTTGGYASTEMNTTTIGAVTSTGSTASGATINQQLYAEFGVHLKTTRELVTNAINATGYNRFGSATGCASNWEWISAQAILLSEIECCGSIVWSSSGCDTGNANRQLPLFVFSKEAQKNRSAYYWLKDIASVTDFCYTSSAGGSDYNGASQAHLHVRPRFVLA